MPSTVQNNPTDNGLEKTEDVKHQTVYLTFPQTAYLLIFVLSLINNGTDSEANMKLQSDVRLVNFSLTFEILKTNSE